MNATIQLRPCYVCRCDPSFGILHVGCSKCERVKEEREQQPRLVVVSHEPLTYGEAASNPLNAPSVQL